MTPLVSVLLPTRDRLELLRYAVQTVLRQDDPDWEVVVSDNESGQDIAGYVAGLEDDRVRYTRTERFVPVTDNWNRALQASSGRYVVMLGDDDGLMPGFLSRLRSLVETFERPDIIYQGAWLFAYPGVIDDEPDGFAQPYGYAEFMRGASAPFVLDPAVAREMVRATMRFQVRFGFNMQFSTVSRELVERLAPQGPFFQSAFPDYYASNVAMLTARRIVVEPRPMVVIGISPKSYGFFHERRDEAGGKGFLEGHEDAESLARATVGEMPGTNINTGWLSAVQAIAQRYPTLVPAQPSLRRFRRLQALYVYGGRYVRRDLEPEHVAAVDAYLSVWERVTLRIGAQAWGFAKRRLGRVVAPALATLHRRLVRQYPAWEVAKLRGRYTTLLELFEDPPPANTTPDDTR